MRIPAFLFHLAPFADFPEIAQTCLIVVFGGSQLLIAMCEFATLLLATAIHEILTQSGFLEVRLGTDFGGFVREGTECVFAMFQRWAKFRFV